MLVNKHAFLKHSTEFIIPTVEFVMHKNVRGRTSAASCGLNSGARLRTCFRMVSSTERRGTTLKLGFRV